MRGARLAAVFGLDVRSLALMRIGVAAITLGDLFTRLRDLRAHYTDAGILPIGWLPRPGPGVSDITLPVSLHTLGGSFAWEAALFGIAIAAAVALLLGWKTRVATIVSWFLAISLFARNPLVAHGGDVLHRMLLFWGMFLPLGARWSIDARGAPRCEDRTTSLATAAYLLQMCVLVWFAALLKHDASWRSDGDAVYRALVIGHTRTPLGDLVLESRPLMKALTFATLIQEGIVAFLLFVPWKTWIFRLVVIGTFIAFHAGLGLMMTLGTFQPLCIVGWIALVPTEAWDRLAGVLRRRKTAAATPGDPVTVEAGVVSRAPLPRLGVAASLAVGSLWLYVLAVNFNQWTQPRSPDDGPVTSALLDVRDAVRGRFTPQTGMLADVLGLDQRWYLFAPKPAAFHGWIVIDGALEDGSHVDLLPFCLDDREEPLRFAKPKRVADAYPNQRWRKYLVNLCAVPDEKLAYRQLFAAYAARRWNESHPAERRLKNVDVYWMRETTQPNYQPPKREKVRIVALDARATDLTAPSAADLTPVLAPR